jgi:hypothetical protein
MTYINNLFWPSAKKLQAIRQVRIASMFYLLEQWLPTYGYLTPWGFTKSSWWFAEKYQ